MLYELLPSPISNMKYSPRNLIEYWICSFEVLGSLIGGIEQS